MLSFYLILLLIGAVAGSHYRGGTVSFAVRSTSGNITNSSQVAVYITQRHSWRRSFSDQHYCNNTNPISGNMIGEGTLVKNPNATSIASLTVPSINSIVRCTDFDAHFDYSSGESTTNVLLPINKRIEYIYAGCCWITLLPPDSESSWSLKLVVNTYPRPDGTLNNSPKTAMNPIVQVPLGKASVIRIPMADSDGDTVRCRWGKTPDECGVVCAQKGSIRSDPCELTYNAVKIGYHAVAIVIEDFDSNNNVLSTIPLQFLIHIVNETVVNDSCPDPPIYIGEWTRDSCIGIESNTTVKTNIQVRIPCRNTSTTLIDISTISPPGLIKGNITRNPQDPSLYTMPIEWTPTPDQYGVHPFCVTPIDSQRRQSSPVCLTFQVNVRPPNFVRMSPSGLVSPTHSAWILESDHDIVRPRRSTEVYIRFFKRSNNQEVYRIDVATDLTVSYQPRQINFYTTGYTWEQGEEYYILLDGGVGTLNQSCGVESAPVQNPYAWVFRVLASETTVVEEILTTQRLVSTTTYQPTSTQTTSLSSQPTCPRWLSFNTISNESTSASEPVFIFCFSVQRTFADVTISANTWVPCTTWKNSGTADPSLELYTEPINQLLAKNDDGNSLPLQNCYAAVLSYRLQRGDYRVIIRNPKCAYGKFELRLTAEFDGDSK